MTSPKLQLLQRGAGIAPTSGHASSQGMQRLERQMRRREQQAPAPAEPSGIGAAFDALLQQKIDEALVAERERHAIQLQQLREQIKSQPQLSPAKKPMPVLETIWHRDGAGRLLWAETRADDGVKFITEITGRDGLGAVKGVRSFPNPPGGYKPVMSSR